MNPTSKLQRYALDKKAPGLFKAEAGKYVHFDEADAEIERHRKLWLAALSAISDAQIAIEYYRAGLEKREPKWIPAQVWLTNPVRGDFPIGHGTVAQPGQYECESNRNGAISVLAENGQRLGLKPSEFEVIAWRANAEIGTGG